MISKHFFSLSTVTATRWQSVAGQSLSLMRSCKMLTIYSTFSIPVKKRSIPRICHWSLGEQVLSPLSLRILYPLSKMLGHRTPLDSPNLPSCNLHLHFRWRDLSPTLSVHPPDPSSCGRSNASAIRSSQRTCNHATNARNQIKNKAALES